MILNCVRNLGAASLNTCGLKSLYSAIGEVLGDDADWERIGRVLHVLYHDSEMSEESAMPYAWVK